MTGDSGILFHVGAHIDALRTKLPGLRYRLRRMHTEFPGFIRTGCDNPAPLSILRIRSHNDRLPFVLRVIPLLHCRIESIHVHMQNRPAHRRKFSPAAAKRRNNFYSILRSWPRSGQIDFSPAFQSGILRQSIPDRDQRRLRSSFAADCVLQSRGPVSESGSTKMSSVLL